MINTLIAQRFTPDWRDRDAAIASYEAHNERVRGGRCLRIGWWSGVLATDGDPCVPLSAWSSHPIRSRT